MNESRDRQRQFLAHGQHGLVCATKMTHASRKVARGFAKRFGANPYKCPACGKWHVATPFRDKRRGAARQKGA